MSYEAFKARVNALIERAGGGIKVWFSTDAEQGKHYANCSDGTTIIGNLSCKRVEVRWGKGEHGYNHKSMVAI